MTGSMDKELDDGLWERAETFAYHSDVPDLTVQHIDLLEAFARSEIARIKGLENIVVSHTKQGEGCSDVFN